MATNYSPSADCRIARVTMVVAFTDYAPSRENGLRDVLPCDFLEGHGVDTFIIDWKEEDLEVVPVRAGSSS